MRKYLIVLICWHCLWVGVALGRVFVDGQQARKIQYASGAAPPAGDASLVVDMNFDEGSGTACADATTNANNGVVSGGAFWTNETRSASGYSMRFRDYPDNGVVTITNAPSISFEGNFTISCWVKMFTTADNYPGFVVKSQIAGDAGDSYGTRNVSGDGPGGIVMSGGTLKQTYSPSDIEGDDTWHHVCNVYDGTNLLNYLDGILVSFIDATGTVNTTTTPVLIGDYGSAGAHPLNGLIDDVQLRNAALSSNAVYELANP